MPRQWRVPTYEYRHQDLQNQFRRLLKVFLEANGDDVIGFAGAIAGMAAGHVRSMLRKGIDSTRLSMFGDRIQEFTGIDLNRMMVIDAKLSILDDLKNLRALRKDDPELAFLLELNPNLERLIDFATLTTREEVVLEIQLIADVIGSPLTAQQLMLTGSVIVKWWDAMANTLPTGDNLKRAILLLTAGPITVNLDTPSRDDARFRIVCRQVLGMDSQEALGVRDFAEALATIGLGDESVRLSIASNRTGLSEGQIKGFRAWDHTTASGKIPASSMGKIIRILLLRQHPDKGVAFDKALAHFLVKKSRGWSGSPVFWPGESKRQLMAESIEPARAQQEAPAAEVEADEPADHADPPDLGTPVLSTSEQIQFEQAIVALRILLGAYPALRKMLPIELTREVTVEVPAPTPEQPPGNGAGHTEEQAQTGPQWFIELCERTTRPDAAELAQIGVIIRSLPRLVQKLLPLPKDQRRRFLKGVDGPMLEVAEMLQALDATEPQKFLGFLDSRLAERLPSGK